MSREEFQQHIEKVLNDKKTPKKLIANNRTVYWDDFFCSVIIKNLKSKHMASMFQPKEGKLFFDRIK